jgi:hypothetical protein
MTDFYEEDEPVDKLLAAFDAGEKGKTAPPDDLDMTEEEFNEAFRNGEPAMIVTPIGFRCQHMTITTGGGSITKPVTWCGCTMTPIFPDQVTSA